MYRQSWFPFFEKEKYICILLKCAETRKLRKCWCQTCLNKTTDFQNVTEGTKQRKMRRPLWHRQDHDRSEVNVFHPSLSLSLSFPDKKSPHVSYFHEFTWVKCFVLFVLSFIKMYSLPAKPLAADAWRHLGGLMKQANWNNFALIYICMVISLIYNKRALFFYEMRSQCLTLSFGLWDFWQLTVLISHLAATFTDKGQHVIESELYKFQQNNKICRSSYEIHQKCRSDVRPSKEVVKFLAWLTGFSVGVDMF